MRGLVKCPERGKEKFAVLSMVKVGLGSTVTRHTPHTIPSNSSSLSIRVDKLL